MSNGQKRPKKNSKFYAMQAKKAKMAKHHIVPELRGFLLSCNSHEKESIREAYNVLNSFADELFGPEELPQNNEAVLKETEDKEGEEEEDIEALLDKEKQEMVQMKSKDVTQRRFQVVGSGVQNLLFIRTTLDDPLKLALKILDDIKESGKQRTRHLMRLIPVERTSKAYEENVTEVAKDILPKWFRDKDELSYCIMFKSRMNNNFDREDAIRVIGTVVRELNPKVTVEYKNPDLVVLVEVMKSICCISVLPRYFELKKYNLIEIANVKPSSTSEKKETDESVIEERKEDNSDQTVHS